MSINFDLFNSFDDVDYSLDGYTDEELLNCFRIYANLMQKIVAYNKLVDNYPNYKTGYLSLFF